MLIWLAVLQILLPRLGGVVESPTMGNNIVLISGSTFCIRLLELVGIAWAWVDVDIARRGTCHGMVYLEAVAVMMFVET